MHWLRANLWGFRSSDRLALDANEEDRTADIIHAAMIATTAQQQSEKSRYIPKISHPSFIRLYGIFVADGASHGLTCYLWNIQKKDCYLL